MGKKMCVKTRKEVCMREGRREREKERKSKRESEREKKRIKIVNEGVTDLYRANIVVQAMNFIKQAEEFQ